MVQWEIRVAFGLSKVKNKFLVFNTFKIKLINCFFLFRNKNNTWSKSNRYNKSCNCEPSSCECTVCATWVYYNARQTKIRWCKFNRCYRYIVFANAVKSYVNDSELMSKKRLCRLSECIFSECTTARLL